MTTNTQPSAMPLVIDVGMYDSSDTLHYLETGHRVVAIEANPHLAKRAERLLSNFISDGRLTIINAAISDRPGEVTLTISGNDLGSSSIFAMDDSAGSFKVAACVLADVIAKHGRPKYLKIDIEGADGIAVLALTKENRPEYVSFEAGADAAALVSHLTAIGYRKFRLVDQVTFREYSRVHCLRDRAAGWIMRRFGFTEPKYVKRAGHWFLSGHSSGPVPWMADGPWGSSADILRTLTSPAITKSSRNIWYDVQAT